MNWITELYWIHFNYPIMIKKEINSRLFLSSAHNWALKVSPATANVLHSISKSAQLCTTLQQKWLFLLFCYYWCIWQIHDFKRYNKSKKKVEILIRLKKKYNKIVWTHQKNPSFCIHWRTRWLGIPTPGGAMTTNPSQLYSKRRSWCWS